MPGSVLGSDTLLTGINGAFGVTKLASEASRAPVATDDTNAGFSVGSLWQYNGQVWICQANTAGLASWQLSWSPPGALLGDVCASIATVAAAYGPARLFAAATTCGIITRASDSTTTTVTFPAGSKVADFNAADAFIEGTTGGWSTLTDQTGNTLSATNATQANMPVFYADVLPNGQRAVAFDGYNTTVKSLTLPAGLSTSTQALTVIMICMPRLNCFAQAYWEMGTSAPNTQQAFYSSTQLKIGYAGTGTTIGNAKTTPTIMAVSFGSSSITVYNDEQTLATPANNPAHTNAGGLLGNIDYASGFAGAYDLLGLIVMSAAITAAQWATIKAAAYAQFNLQPQLKNNLIVAGDSIGAGYNGVNTNSLPWFRALQYQMAAAGTPISIVNNSTPSQTLALIVASPTVYFTGSIIAGKNNIVLFQAGTNDMALASATPAAILASLQTGIAAARAAGASKVGAMTILPRPNLGTFTEVNRQAYNALVRSSSGADFIIDVGADPVMGAAGADLSATLYYTDNVHPLAPLGYSYLANDLYTALKPILV